MQVALSTIVQSVVIMQVPLSTIILLGVIMQVAISMIILSIHFILEVSSVTLILTLCMLTQCLVNNSSPSMDGVDFLITTLPTLTLPIHLIVMAGFNLVF